MRFLKQSFLQALMTFHFSLPDPARCPPLFQSSPLKESLAQAIPHGKNIAMFDAILKSPHIYPVFHWLIGCYINEWTSLNLH